MLPTLPLVIIGVFNLIIFIVAIYYLFRIKSKEKAIEKLLQQSDNNYHHIVDEALSKERKIIDDATNQADHIITDAQYISSASQAEIHRAITHVVDSIGKEGEAIAQIFTSQYTSSLKNLTNESLQEFQNVMTNLQDDLKKQIVSFHETLLPEVEKELEEYKKARMAQAEQMVSRIVQKASQEIFNKTLSLEDHQNIIVESLEKAKKEGLFD